MTISILSGGFFSPPLLTNRVSSLEGIWDKIDYGTDEEKLEAETELLGKLLYYEGD